MMKWWFTIVGLALLLPSAPALAQEDPPIDEARIVSALRRYRREPTVSAMVHAALASRSSTPGRVRDAMDRARATGWLPTARAGVRRGQAVDLRGLTGGATNTDLAPLNVSTDDDLMLQVRLEFRFDRIVFASEEVSLLRELRATEAQEQELSRIVVQLYFERRRLQLERDLARVTDLARRLRILEIEALLDAFTAGAFTRMMGRLGGDG